VLRHAVCHPPSNGGPDCACCLLLRSELLTALSSIGDCECALAGDAAEPAPCGVLYTTDSILLATRRASREACQLAVR
jgi:hypothetical protein